MSGAGPAAFAWSARPSWRQTRAAKCLLRRSCESRHIADGPRINSVGPRSVGHEHVYRRPQAGSLRNPRTNLAYARKADEPDDLLCARMAEPQQAITWSHHDDR